MKTDVHCCGLTNSTVWNLTFRGPCIVIYSYNKSQQDALFLKFILVKYSTCFGQVHCPSSGVSQHHIHAAGVWWLSASTHPTEHARIKHSVDACNIKTKFYFLNSWSLGVIPEGLGNFLLTFTEKCRRIAGKQTSGFPGTQVISSCQIFTLVFKHDQSCSQYVSSQGWPQCFEMFVNTHFAIWTVESFYENEGTFICCDRKEMFHLYPVWRCCCST